ncbi:TetR/AcrR family transcriptional regulator C-terminal domain-containing protein [Streptomyces sp. YGL11-2]|uniref:TetR/AcrR family transcriptional regulator C-terminal domain-containing protein n=1 Tax=Streptomyces sp. YGL11-2 TaxID=3414028 RepID=UPI003CF013B9
MVSRIDREQVAGTALRLLNDVGLDGLTLRRIAKELNVQAPALYWHFRNKQELLDEMATEMFRRMTGPLVAEHRAGTGEVWGTWQEMLVATCSTLREALLGYRDGAKMISGTRMTDDSFAAPLELFMSHFTAAGFALPEAARAWWTAYNFTIGVVIEEQSVYPDPAAPQLRDPAYDVADREGRLAADYPLAAKAGRQMFGDFEEAFRTGLRIIIAGIEANHSPGAGS